MSYARFALMIVTSILVMFGLMYLNTYALDHVQFSQTRMWMAIVMGAAMAIIMIGFMWAMYENRRANIGIVLGSLSVFALALWLVRSQQTVGDVAYMRAMTPHHSIAIMTSERARIRDPEVRQLADRIIQAQLKRTLSGPRSKYRQMGGTRHHVSAENARCQRSACNQHKRSDAVADRANGDLVEVTSGRVGTGKR
jgi:hypothetical protein